MTVRGCKIHRGSDVPFVVADLGLLYDIYEKAAALELKCQSRHMINLPGVDNWRKKSVLYFF